MTASFPIPVIDYTSRDYLSYRQDMIDLIPTFLPEWTSRSPNDFGIVLIELFASLADRLSFYQDRIANEAFLQTAVRRSSVLAIASMLDYRPTDPIAATVQLQFTVNAGVGTVTIPAKTQVSTADITNRQPPTPIIFETDADLVINSGATTVGNISATQGITYANENLGNSTGDTNQIFLLFHSPVIEASTRVFVDEGLGPMEWTFTSHLLDNSSTDTVFTTFTDDNGVLNVKFGDGVNGRVPSINAVISSTYRVGGGQAGNVGIGSIIKLVNPVTNVVGVTNSGNAQNGADAETLDQIRSNAPKALRTLNRAVALEDYGALAVKVPGVSKAIASSAIYTSVLLYIAVPPGGGTATLATKNAVQAYFLGRTLPGVTVTVGDATYVPIYISADVHVKSTFKQSVVQSEAVVAIKTLLSFDNVDFADRITLSEVYQAVMAVDGVDYIVVTVLSRTSTGLADVQLATNEIATTDDAHLTITASGGIT